MAINLLGMELLKQHPTLNIAEVAHLTGTKQQDLRDAQLKMLRTKIKRDSEDWDKPNYGR